MAETYRVAVHYVLCFDKLQAIDTTVGPKNIMQNNCLVQLSLKKMVTSLHINSKSQKGNGI